MFELFLLGIALCVILPAIQAAPGTDADEGPDPDTLPVSDEMPVDDSDDFDDDAGVDDDSGSPDEDDADDAGDDDDADGDEGGDSGDLPGDQFSPAVLQLANRYGINPVQARMYGTEADLLNALSAIGPPGGGHVPQQTKAQPQAEQQAEAKPVEIPDFSDWDGDPATLQKFAASVTAMRDQLQAELSGMRGVVSKWQEDLGVQSAQREEAEFDNWCNAQDESMGLGQGSAETLKSKEPGAFQNRVATFQAYDGLRKSYTDRGLPPPPMARLLDAALRAVAGDNADKRASQRLQKELNKRASKTSARPTRRKSRMPADGDKKAAAIWDGWRRKNRGNVQTAADIEAEFAD
jgi:hypothetical protein